MNLLQAVMHDIKALMAMVTRKPELNPEKDFESALNQ